MSRPPGQDRRLTKVLAALRQHGGPGRSPLYRWMRRHHDALAAAFAETPPAWIPPAVHAVATAGDPTPRPRISLDIRPARPAAGASPASPADATGAPQVETSPAPPTAAEETPAEQMRRLLTSMEARKVPLPKLM